MRASCLSQVDIEMTACDLLIESHDLHHDLHLHLEKPGEKAGCCGTSHLLFLIQIHKLNI